PPGSPAPAFSVRNSESFEISANEMRNVRNCRVVLRRSNRGTCLLREGFHLAAGAISGGNVAMKSQRIVVLLAAWFVLLSGSGLEAQKVKVIVDQDARGPATTDMQSILIFL